jgi:hypothetical protein
VQYRYTTLAIFFSGLIVCLALVPSGILRVTFFPSVPSDNISITLDMPQGTPWQKTHEYARRIEDAARAMNARFKAQDAQGRDVIKTLQTISDSDTQARTQLELIVSEEREIDSTVLGQWLREELGTLQGVRSFRLDAAAGPGGSPIDVQLQGRDLEQLRQAASELKLQLGKVEGVRDIRDSFNSGGRELNIKVTPEGEALGLGDVELARQVRQAFFGAEIQRVQRGRDEVRVYVRLPRTIAAGSRRCSPCGLRCRMAAGSRSPWWAAPTSRQVSALSTASTCRGWWTCRQTSTSPWLPPARSRGLSSERRCRISSSATRRCATRSPARSRSSATPQRALIYGGLIVMLLIYAALAIPLKSYLEPLLIMSVIPFGVTGALLGHLILGMDVSVLSAIGMIGLVGVVVNDSLVMVDFINHYIEEGHDWKSAVLEAGPMRFRAIILTSLTTFIGLLPIQLETSIQAQFVKPMATSVGGLWHIHASRRRPHRRDLTLILVARRCYAYIGFRMALRIRGLFHASYRDEISRAGTAHRPQHDPGHNVADKCGRGQGNCGTEKNTEQAEQLTAQVVANRQRHKQRDKSGQGQRQHDQLELELRPRIIAPAPAQVPVAKGQYHGHSRAGQQQR